MKVNMFAMIIMMMMVMMIRITILQSVRATNDDI